ncbi:M50 family metallopeptidase [Hamadaea sp. NPDC051192]|uniref:M50 family metallopeptidase n=1 Tax=Hamadaea sp. NPDC051192 TaxID=3154940 RepID=UPI00342708F0
MTDSDLPVWKLRRADLWWLLGYPVYQIFGTIRHEGSHALVAKLEGADVTNFVFWPQTDLGRFTWGYTQWTGDTGWATDAAPYLCDLLWFVGFFFLLTRLPIRNHLVWLNLAIIGLLSPAVNSFWQWLAGIFGSDETDVAKWLDAWPDVVVHLYFVVTVTAYVIGIVAVTLRCPSNCCRNRPSPDPLGLADPA